MRRVSESARRLFLSGRLSHARGFAAAKMRERRLEMEQLEQRVVLATFDFDFSVDDGGFTSRGVFGATPWTYTGSEWHSVTELGAQSLLISPVFTADDTSVTFSMDHQHDLYEDPSRTGVGRYPSGGVLQVSINGGPFSNLEIDGGYPIQPLEALGFVDGWGGSSEGEVTDTAAVEVAVDDTVQFQLRVQFAFSPQPGPNWVVKAISVNTGGAADGEVVSRNIFYNSSFFDVPPPAAAADAADDRAIATDKTALLPGETGTFANYTSYALGINGIMVDIADLASEPTVETIDNFFEFSVGNDDSPDDWGAAPSPVEVSLRAGEGLDGSDRVTILWEAGAIQNGWLQTTVLANADTGLEQPDVFYFGNAVGDSGNSAAEASVNAQDIGGARDNPHNFLNRAVVDDAFDYNRDSLVNAQDIGIARDNPTNFLSDLNLITVPTAAPAAAAASASLTVNSGVSKEVLPAPLRNLAMTELVIGSSSQDVVNDVPLPEQRSRLVDDAYRRLGEAESGHPDREQSESLEGTDLLLQGDLIDILAEDGWSSAR